MGEPSLRERKKEQTRSTLWNLAIELFTEHGFDSVSVAQIAAAANVSKMTVFNYFATKEELVVGPMAEHIHEPAQIVRDRAVGESAVAAIRRHFLDALALRDPNTGLSESPNILAVQRLVRATPALKQRAYGILARTEESLTDELAAQTGGAIFIARLSAALILSTRNALVLENADRIIAGESADAVYPDAAATATRAFHMLEHGLGDYATRT